MLWLQSFFEDPPVPRAPVNPWSLRKSARIKSLLIRLEEQVPGLQWQVDFTQRSPLDGIYLVHPASNALRAYLHVHGQRQGKAGLHLEFPAVYDRGPSYESYEDLTLARLADMLAAHFGIGTCATH